MGRIRPGDERLHHCDWSHRWLGGPLDDAGQKAYQAELRAHVEAHRAGEDMPPAQHKRTGPGSGPPTGSRARPASR